VQDCILIVGDSVAYGTLVVEIPTVGFAVVRTKPFSLYLDELLRITEAIHFGIYDLTVEAKSLAGPDPYTLTAEYQKAVSTYCRFVLVFPWLNDLGNPAFTAQPELYVQPLAQFVGGLLEGKPESRAVVMGYYRMQPAPFAAATYGGGVSDDHILRLNAALAAACAEGGALAQVGAVTYFDTQAALMTLGEPYTLGALSSVDFYASLYQPLPAPDASLFEVYWRDNPTGQVNADGVHLTGAAKNLLANALYQHLLALDSDALQPLTHTQPVARLP
jgi:hypothetical protein